jgi:hypothetical protein
MPVQERVERPEFCLNVIDLLTVDLLGVRERGETTEQLSRREPQRFVALGAQDREQFFASSAPSLCEL